MKIKWVVDEKPTGRYRSFQPRAWPTGWVNGHLVFGIRCEDGYVPYNARTGKHAPLRLAVFRRSTPEQVEKHGSKYWAIYTTTFLDLEGAKAFAVERLASDQRLQEDLRFWRDTRRT